MAQSSTPGGVHLSDDDCMSSRPLASYVSPSSDCAQSAPEIDFEDFTFYE